MSYVAPRKVTPSLETAVGLLVSYLDPKPEDIRIEDIARSLSQTVRYRGHTHWFYSVAEHALDVRRRVIKAGHPELALAALHHDDHEAYLGDWPTPLKAAVMQLVGADVFAILAQRFDNAIGEAMGVDPDLFHHDVVRQADFDALMAEASALKVSQGTGPHWGGNRLAAKAVPRRGLPMNYLEERFKEADHESR